MKKVIIGSVVIVALAGLALYLAVFKRNTAAQAANAGGPQSGGGTGAGRGAGRAGRVGAAPMTVEVATARKAQMSQQLTVVGNLIGDATVSVVPKVAGRLQEVYVRLGDRVGRGQRVAKIEDQEIQEQVKQAQAAFEVANATIRQRDADLALAKTNVDRSRSLYERLLLPKQTLDDNEARYQAAVAQLDLTRAQARQSQARLDELRITLANTTITSPVDGFVARRAADPGAFASQNAPIVDVVDIRRVRLVVNVVEKDLRSVNAGDTATVSVDAFPGESFAGRITRVAPVLDPTTRTASIELEIPNSDFRLKPGMYARVSITTDNKQEALAVPSNALVDVNGRRGIYLATDAGTASFHPVRVGIEEEKLTEILEGVNEGDTVITTGAAALTDGARFTIVGQKGRGRGGDGSATTPLRNGQVGSTPASAGQRVNGETDGASPRAGNRPNGRPMADGAAAVGRDGAQPGAGERDGFARRSRPDGQAPAGY